VIAYFRMKTDANASSSEIARIKVIASSDDDRRAPISIRGTDFTAAGQYQEFAVPFTFSTDPNFQFLTFEFSASGSATVWVDAITVFTAPQTFTPTYTWNVPGGHYRGQGVWVRYSNADGSGFTPYTEAQTSTPLVVRTGPVKLLSEVGQTSPEAAVTVETPCGGDWRVLSTPSWAQTRISAGRLYIRGSQSSIGSFNGSVTVEATGTGFSVAIPVQYTVVEEMSDVFLPVILK
jgi:hypothetical protein